MKVYIVRHGEVPHNALKQYNNQNEDLTKKGIKLKFNSFLSSKLCL